MPLSAFSGWRKLRRWANLGCWGLSLVMMVFLGVQWLTPWQWVVVLGESVRGTVALMEPPPSASGDYRQGDYVVMRWQGDDPNHQARLKPGMRLIKRIGCGPGHHLRVSDKDASCDGRFLGTVRERNRQGQPLKPALYDGAVPPRHYFLMGDHPASYDSRYFGLIPAQGILGRLFFRL